MLFNLQKDIGKGVAKVCLVQQEILGLAWLKSVFISTETILTNFAVCCDSSSVWKCCMNFSWCFAMQISCRKTDLYRINFKINSKIHPIFTRHPAEGPSGSGINAILPAGMRWGESVSRMTLMLLKASQYAAEWSASTNVLLLLCCQYWDWQVQYSGDAIDPEHPKACFPTMPTQLIPNCTRSRASTVLFVKPHFLHCQKLVGLSIWWLLCPRIPSPQHALLNISSLNTLFGIFVCLIVEVQSNYWSSMGEL